MRQGITLITNAESAKSNVTAKEAADVYDILFMFWFKFVFQFMTKQEANEDKQVGGNNEKDIMDEIE